ncbi:MAG: hypothetical protein J0M04_18515 [Verrucomicrobia bacterium]|nr:hypothetical protein [Verrucomicrobiota bacterium]
MNLTISVSDLAAARKLLTRIRFARLSLPVLNHVLATVDAAGLTLAVTDLDHWLETRLPAVIEPFAPGRFLIPAEALKAAAAGDKHSHAHFVFEDTPDGPKLTLTVPCSGMNAVSVHRPEPADQFPARPSAGGAIAHLPCETFVALGRVAGLASTDPTRHVLNGVFFTPDRGGELVATNGRTLALAPVRFSGHPFILPSAAARVLVHPDFATRDAAICQETSDGNVVRVMFRSGPHTLLAKTIEGIYPNYRQVIPADHTAEAVIPEAHRPGLIAWLRSLSGRRGSVVLRHDRPGQLGITLEDYDSDSETVSIRVPAAVSGEVPVIAYDPAHFADVLAIGSALRFTDGMSATLLTAPDGTLCVLMPTRCHASSAIHHATAPPATHPAAA